MIEILRDVQIPFLACVLLLACVTKLIIRNTDPALGVPPHRRRPFVIGVALAEGTLGIALFITPTIIVRLACVVFFATATSIVGDLTRRGADEGCGCFGGLSTAPAGRRGVLRAGLLTVAAIGSVGVPESGGQVIEQAGLWSVLLLLVETAILLALSPELAVAVERTRNTTPCELLDVPLAETYQRLHTSDAWREREDSLTSAKPVEVWRELCIRYVVYPATIDGRSAEVVFAVPVDGRRADVRAGVAWDASYEEPDDDSGPRRVQSPV